MSGVDLLTVRRPDPTQLHEIADLLRRIEGASGHRPLGEPKLMQLFETPPSGTGTTGSGTTGSGTTGSGSERTMVSAILATDDHRRLVGYAHVGGAGSPHRFATELAVDPDVGSGVGDADDLATRLLDAVIDGVAGGGGGELRLWVPMATGVDDHRAVSRGFRIERTLLQLRCSLPLGPDRDHPSDQPITTRPFRPGADEAAWLTVNNRAFASHPEQGGWDLTTLLDHERQEWFDPDGFLLLEEDGRLAGSCWTKVHAAVDPPLGEIYVIGVDPDFHGRGWGRALTRAGLAWLAGQGLTTGMLYVDADNDAAVSLYRSMGFVEHHADRAYVVEVAAG